MSGTFDFLDRLKLVFFHVPYLLNLNCPCSHSL